jgi:hypothetical protein
MFVTPNMPVGQPTQQLATTTNAGNWDIDTSMQGHH